MAAALLPARAVEAAGGPEGATEHYAFFSPQFPGKLRARVIADLDGDGRGDVGIVLESPEDGALRFESCLQGRDGTFAACSSAPIPAISRMAAAHSTG